MPDYDATSKRFTDKSLFILKVKQQDAAQDQYTKSGACHQKLSLEWAN